MIFISKDGIFHTLQGEGVTIGQQAIFIRFQNCNLQCVYCDTPYTWNRNHKDYNFKKISDSDLMSLILKKQKETNCKRLVFTGGEPLLQQDFIVEFKKKYPSSIIEIETNGTIAPLEELFDCQFNCSPKLKNSGNSGEKRFNKNVLIVLNKLNTNFKFVCKNKEDIDEILNNYYFLDKNKIFIMPEGNSILKNIKVYDKIREKIIKEGLNTSIRLQNILFKNVKEV